ncbi:response regulator [Streptococcus pluranimalium]|uniref:response regulator transcription factor n=1 Tax=Streptococcus pluranimalium TaxID=82348 RepID=UPI0039FBA9B5
MFGLLIVEDEPLVRQGLLTLIDYKQFGIDSVLEAADGRQAWAIFEKNPTSIVLTDINMPHMNGITLAQVIKEKHPQTHVVFLTGYDEFDYALSALKLGADDYLLKPFSRTDIEALIGRICNQLKTARQKSEIQKLSQTHALSDIEKTIQKQLYQPNLNLKSLAYQLGFSPNYLSRLIKDELGQPFQNYIIAERVKKAKLLLLTTDWKIYEIAHSVGFEDINYFSQRFKLETGMTPKQYRKEHST